VNPKWDYWCEVSLVFLLYWASYVAIYRDDGPVTII
jgi:hypothetical protein